MKCSWITAFSTPAQHGVACKLRAVIKADCLGEAAFKSEIFETADDVVAPKRETDLQGKAFAGEVVDDRSSSERSAVCQSVVHEVDRPALVGPRDTAGSRCRGCSVPCASFAAVLVAPGSDRSRRNRDSPTSTPSRRIMISSRRQPHRGRSCASVAFTRRSRRRLWACRGSSSVRRGCPTIAHARAWESPVLLQSPHRFFSLRGLQPFFAISSRTASTSMVSRAITRSLRVLSASSCFKPRRDRWFPVRHIYRARAGSYWRECHVVGRAR